MHEAFLVCIDNVGRADVVEPAWLANCFAVVEVRVVAVIDVAAVTRSWVRRINLLEDIVRSQGTGSGFCFR